MKIRPEVEIFDDSEHCNLDDDNCCDRLIYQEFNSDQPFCTLYLEKLEDKTTEEFDEWEYLIVKKFKFSQCKADFLQAKREEPCDEIIIDGYKFESIPVRMHMPCHVQAILLLDENDRQEFMKRFNNVKEVSYATHQGLFTGTNFLFANAQYSHDSGRMAVEIIIKRLRDEKRTE